MRAILIIVVSFALLFGLHACRNGQDADESTEPGESPYTLPEEEEPKIGLEDEPAEEALPYEGEQGVEEPVVPEEVPEIDPEY